jgi:NAD(P)-dependent dehydrogenase (short-subunit alcohol dehydrogenase family)
MEFFKDTVAIVTGGASGIGRGIAVELASKGSHVVIVDINAEGAGETVSTINSKGGSASALMVDVSKAEDVKRAIKKTADEFGRLDYMFNNAGISYGGGFDELTLKHWEHVMSINLWGVIYGSYFAYESMLRQGFGHIVNTASLAGIIPSMGGPYTTSKHAVVGLSQSLRLEAMNHGIKVSVVCPGFIKTPIFDTTVNLSKEFTDEKIKVFLSKIKMTSPEDCAKIIMKGIMKNKSIITVTPLARNLWLMYRLFPELFLKMSFNNMKKIHKKYVMDEGVRS